MNVTAVQAAYFSDYNKLQLPPVQETHWVLNITKTQRTTAHTKPHSHNKLYITFSETKSRYVKVDRKI